MKKENSSVLDIRHLKTPSLRELMSGKKNVKKLPPNYFEKVLDQELELKRNFSMENLQALVDLYSLAIEYYSSIEDSKFRDYQNRLNMLLSNPAILKKMNDFSKAKTSVASSSVDNQSIVLAEKAKLKKEKKQQMKNKVNYIYHINNLTNNDTAVKEIIENMEKEDNFEHIINQNIINQEDNFRLALEKKRKKRSTKNEMDLAAHLSGFRRRDDEESGFDSERRVEKNLIYDIDEGVREFDVDTKIVKEAEEQDPNEEDKTDSDDDNDDIESIEKLKERKEEVEKKEIATGLGKLVKEIKLSTLIEVETPPTSTPRGDYEGKSTSADKQLSTKGSVQSSQSLISDTRGGDYLGDSKVLNPKHKQIFADIKQTIDNFIAEFNVYFYEHVFQKFTDQIQKIMDDKYQKYIEVSKNYHSQIKEMEYLLNSNESDDSHKDSIKIIVESLKEEQQSELERIDEHFSNLITEAHNNFKNVGFKNNQGIQYLEEKFKLDIFNLINNILHPKK